MSIKGKALKRAMETKDAHRLEVQIPLITDSTEHITPEMARKMLERNRNNRPINWNRVHEFSRLMKEGKWKLHAQGIILDGSGNILTGQKRLWAIVYSGVSQYMRVSKGSPPDTADLIDRGAPQTARDLASRKTDRKHSPMEASIARAMLALQGEVRPTPDKIAEVLTANSEKLTLIVEASRRTKKTKTHLMVLAAICATASTKEELLDAVGRLTPLVAKAENKLLPTTVDKCWGKGAAFTLAMRTVQECVWGKGAL